MGAVAITKKYPISPLPGSKPGEKALLCKLTMSASYATGGDTLSVATLGLKRVTGAWVAAHTADVSAGVGGGYAGYDIAEPTDGNKITFDVSTQTAPKVLLTKGGQSAAEETATTDVSSTVFWCIITGEGG